MPSILIGQYDDFESADAAITELQAAGVADHAIEKFHLNAPGQNDSVPIAVADAADVNARQGDEGAISGAAAGAVAGLAVGVVALPVLGPFAAAAGLAVGAYTGSLAGAVSSMGEGQGPAITSVVPPRPAGVRVAVVVEDENRSKSVERIFRKHEARSIEYATATWGGGRMTNFDAISTPHWIVPPQP